MVVIFGGFRASGDESLWVRDVSSALKDISDNDDLLDAHKRGWMSLFHGWTENTKVDDRMCW